MSTPGRPKSEFRNAQHGGCPMTRRAAPKANTAARSAEATQ